MPTQLITIIQEKRMFPQRFTAACCLELTMKKQRATYVSEVRCHGTFKFKGFTFAIHDPVEADKKKFQMVVSEVTTGWSLYKMRTFGSQDDAIHQATAFWRQAKITPSQFQQRLDEIRSMGMTAAQLQGNTDYNWLPVWLYSSEFFTGF